MSLDTTLRRILDGGVIAVVRAESGAELVPVLQREADAVTAEFERQFPRTRAMSSGTLDARGWQAGRDAADRAVLVAGRLTA